MKETIKASCVVCLLLAGCSYGIATAVVVSKKANDANTSPKRLLVQSHLVSSVDGENFGPFFARAFNEKLIEGLENCGTTTTVFTVTGVELGNGEFLKQMDAFKPDAVMVVRRAGGGVFASGFGLWVANFGISLYDASKESLAKYRGGGGSLKVVWRASLSLNRGAPARDDLERAGRIMATELLKQMKEDGFFPGCAKLAGPTAVHSESAKDAVVDCEQAVKGEAEGKVSKARLKPLHNAYTSWPLGW